MKFTTLLKNSDIFIPRNAFAAAELKIGDITNWYVNDDNTVLLCPSERKYAPLFSSRIDNQIRIKIADIFYDTVKWTVGNPIRIQPLGEKRLLLSQPSIEELMEDIPDRYDVTGNPIPPQWMIQAFSNRPEISNFLKGGRDSARLLDLFCSQHGVDLSDLECFLDFGCGCARVTRWLPEYTNAQLFGTDLHENAIQWNKKWMRFGKYFVGTEKPKKLFSANMFDGLLALSVLTHLDEATQVAWLKEWARIMRPGGIAFVTFHGNGFVENVYKGSKIGDLVSKSFKEDSGFLYLKEPLWEGIFPECYGTAYHSFGYVESVWSKYFDVMEIKQSGDFSNRQDMAVMRAR